MTVLSPSMSLKKTARAGAEGGRPVTAGVEGRRPLDTAGHEPVLEMQPWPRADRLLWIATKQSMKLKNM